VTIDFSLPAEALAFEAEVRAFFQAVLTPEVQEEIYRSGVSHDAEVGRQLGERGWVVPDWDGPGSIDPYAVHLLVDETARTEAPTYALSTTTMVAKVIRAVGSEELKAEVLDRAVRGQLTIAFGMTEPEAGSDVANVQTRARRDGDEWVIDGSKMFTTNGHVTDFVFLLARTSNEGANHKGLTTFLVPVGHPGFEAQAVYTLSGERTNITYYSDLRLDDRWRIGEVGGGWNALMQALQEEHSVGFSPHLDRLLDECEAWARTPGPDGGAEPLADPDVRERLTRAATELEVAQLLELRTTWMEANHLVPVAEGPMAKLFSTEALVRQAEELCQLVGPDALRSKLDPTALRDGRIEHALRFSVGTTIYAGTSEVQRNIIAQRACGLPR
jgi:alkylation response protein AidB-like acyl-CoA dehydrogenase